MIHEIPLPILILVSLAGKKRKTEVVDLKVYYARLEQEYAKLIADAPDTMLGKFTKYFMRRELDKAVRNYDTAKDYGLVTGFIVNEKEEHG